jgi:hypothetical protein
MIMYMINMVEVEDKVVNTLRIEVAVVDAVVEDKDSFLHRNSGVWAALLRLLPHSLARYSLEVLILLEDVLVFIICIACGYENVLLSSMRVMRVKSSKMENISANSDAVSKLLQEERDDRVLSNPGWCPWYTSICLLWLKSSECGSRSSSNMMMSHIKFSISSLGVS